MLKILFLNSYLLDISIILTSIFSINILTVNPAFSQVNQTVRTYKVPGGNIIKVITPNYDIDESPGGLRVTTPVGSVTNNIGFTVKPLDVVESSVGTVITSEGLIIGREGKEITTPAGRVYSSEGFDVNPDGSYSTPSGTVITPYGNIIRRGDVAPF